MATHPETFSESTDHIIEETAVPALIGGAVVAAELGKLSHESWGVPDVLLFGVGTFFVIGALSKVFNYFRDRHPRQ